MTYLQTKRVRLFTIMVLLLTMGFQQATAKNQLETITFIPSLSDALTPAEAAGAADPAMYDVVAVRNFSVKSSDMDPAYDPLAAYVPIEWPVGAGIVFNSYSIKNNVSVPANGFLSGYLSTSNAVNGNTIRFENLKTNSGYLLLVYSQSSSLGDAVSFRVNGATIGTLTTVDPTGTTFTEGINYLKVNALSDEYGMITLNYANASGRGVVNAVQIGVASNPEPGTVTLLAFGLGALFLARYTRMVTFEG